MTVLAPYAARDLPPLPVDMPHDPAFQELVTAVNGFVYPGDRLDAIVFTLRVLRAHPDIAARLLGEGDPR